MPLPRRRLGPFAVSALGLGCMNLSHAYGEPPPAAAAEALLRRALDLGVTLFDTAALYGFGANESMVGRVLKPYRARITLASKCGMTGVDGKRVIDGRPATLRRTCEEALQRLQTEVIDLYYLHRLDPQVPVEDSVGALGELVSSGKIRAIGLSEVSAATLRRAHAVQPITAVQNEYSLWTREPEIALLAECRRLGVAFVAFSPLAVAVRQVLPRGVETTQLNWTYLGFEDDTPEQHLTRLKQANLIGPAGYISMEDGCVGGFVQRGIAGASNHTAVLEMGGIDAESSDSRITEASIRGFWKAYRAAMDL